MCCPNPQPVKALVPLPGPLRSRHRAGPGRQLAIQLRQLTGHLDDEILALDPRWISKAHNGRVSKEYATLLAQVVPVLALALGLELRAIVGRTKERAAAVDATDDSNPGFWHGASLGILGFILTLLAGIEIRALYVVAGPDGFWNDLTVPLTTAIVFLAPVAVALYGVHRAEGTAPWPAAWRVAAWMAVFTVFLVLEFFSF